MTGFTAHKAGISSALQEKAAQWPWNANHVSHLVPFTLMKTFSNISSGQCERSGSRSSTPTVVKVKGVSENEHWLDKVPV